MHDGRAPDVLIVSLGATEGLRRADRALCDGLRRAGARAGIVAPPRPRERPTLMLTDLAWARAARAAAVRALRDAGGAPPKAIVYSSTTAALLWPRPGAIRFDAPASGNRPGRHGLWQRPLEARRLASAPLLLPWSDGALREAPASAGAGGDGRALVVPVAIARPAVPAAEGERDIAAITYAANPVKKGLDRVLAAWRARRRDPRAPAGEELHITGTDAAELRRAGVELAGVDAVRLHAGLAADDYRALVRRARVFVTAPRREDYGISQLEALAEGCMLVTTPAPGPYAALPIARELDPRLVGGDLAVGLAAALDAPRAGYARRAHAALEPYSEEAVERLIADELVARLLA